MGLLDKLWDDVVAGPQPDKGLGRLRGKARVPGDVNPSSEEINRMDERRRSGDFSQSQDEARRITQSIAIAKPPPLTVADSGELDPGSNPSTPGAAKTLSPIVGSPSLFPRAASLPSSPHLGSSTARERENVWTSVFHPGSSKHMRKLGSEKFDKQAPNSPAVYDWLYSKDTKSSWR